MYLLIVSNKILPFLTETVQNSSERHSRFRYHQIKLQINCYSAFLLIQAWFKQHTKTTSSREPEFIYFIFFCNKISEFKNISNKCLCPTFFTVFSSWKSWSLSSDEVWFDFLSDFFVDFMVEDFFFWGDFCWFIDKTQAM